MVLWELVATLAGLILVLGALGDAFLAVTHVDSNGPMAFRFSNVIWRLLTPVTRRWPRIRRPAFALAGPLMIAATFLLWTGLYILGVALVTWPQLENFRTDPELGNPGFIGAVYYAGVTATVLGYGDITPLSSGMRLVAFAISGLGFALFTGIITYLISLVTGVAERNALATRIYTLSGRSTDGARAITRRLPQLGPTEIGADLRSLDGRMASVYEKMLQFPILDLHFRSQNAVHDPERMICAAARAALATRVLSHAPRYGSLGVAAEDLSASTAAMMELVAANHLTRDISAALATPEPTAADREVLREIGQQVENGVGESLRDWEDDAEALRLASRARIFLEALDRFTGLRDDTSPHAQGH